MSLAQADGSGEIVISAGRPPAAADYPAELLARNAAEAAAWESPVIRRQRILSLEGAARDTAGPPPRRGRPRRPTMITRAVPAEPARSAPGGAVLHGASLYPPEEATLPLPPGGPAMAAGDW